MQVSSSQMGLDLATLMQPTIPEGRGRLGPQGYAPPRSVEGSWHSMEVGIYHGILFTDYAWENPYA